MTVPTDTAATEFGIEWVYRDGRSFVAAQANRTGARHVVSRCAGAGYEPRAVRVMRRSVGEWEADQ